MGSPEAGLDREAQYEALYQAHQARIVRLCRLLLASPADAEEVGQEVFLKLLHACRTETRLIEWGPWLTRVAVNACRDRRRSRWWRLVRESSVQLAEAAITSAEPSPEARAVSREHHHRVWTAFRRLSARQQEVFALRHLEGWSTDAVAEALTLSPGSVKRHLFRAVHHLRTALEGR